MKFPFRRPPPTPEEVLEAKLIRECKQGQVDSYEYFVKQNQNRLFHVALQVLRDECLAEEAVQITFIKGWKKIGSFRGNARFATWLHRLCINTAWDLLRQRMREKEHIAQDEPGSNKILLDTVINSETPPDRALIRSEIRDLVMQAMDQLPEEQRLVLVLREMQGLDYKEIARTLKCREGTVMSRLFHARRKVRKLLEKII